MVSTANKVTTKTVTWTTDRRQAFKQLKELVNGCPRLYFIYTAYKIVLYTRRIMHTEHTCQVVSATAETEEHEEPIRFLSGAFHRAQTRRSTIEKEAFAIYWTLGRLADLLGGMAFTLRTDHRNLLYLNNNGS
jgi:hypothetical protein